MPGFMPGIPKDLHGGALLIGMAVNSAAMTLGS